MKELKCIKIESNETCRCPLCSKENELIGYAVLSSDMPFYIILDTDEDHVLTIRILLERAIAPKEFRSDIEYSRVGEPIILAVDGDYGAKIKMTPENGEEWVVARIVTAAPTKIRASKRVQENTETTQEDV